MAVRMRVVDPTKTSGAIPIKLSTASGALIPEYVTDGAALPVRVAPAGLTGAIPVTVLPTP